MSSLQWQIWTVLRGTEVAIEGRLDRKMASGVIPLSMTHSAQIPILTRDDMDLGVGSALVGLFKVIGSDRAFVEIRDDGQTTTQSSSPAVRDDYPRTLIGAEDGTICERIPFGGSFSAVQAEALA